MKENLYKPDNKILLLYHLVFPLKYRRWALNTVSGVTLKNICIEISDRYEIQFVEIGYESDHVHFLVQGVPSMSVSRLVTLVKSMEYSVQDILF